MAALLEEGAADNTMPLEQELEIAARANARLWNHLQLVLDGISILAGAFGKRCLRGGILSASMSQRWPFRSVGVVLIN